MLDKYKKIQISCEVCKFYTSVTETAVQSAVCADKKIGQVPTGTASEDTHFKYTKDNMTDYRAENL